MYPPHLPPQPRPQKTPKPNQNANFCLTFRLQNATDKPHPLLDIIVSSSVSYKIFPPGCHKNLTFPQTGQYHVWVRTINWTPGEWDAPDCFQLVVDKQEVEIVQGNESEWTWQYVGSDNIDTENTIIELQDLTGFDGRCDAIYFSTTKQQPPNQKDELSKWRKAQLNENNKPKQSQNFDLVIVGGDIAGCAAAISSAEQELNVALVHDRPLLGGNASSEIRVHTLGITWHYDRILKLINAKQRPENANLKLK